MPKIILIVGRKKSGKTTLAKERFGSLPNLYVADVNNEYNLPTSNKPEPGTRAVTHDMESVIEKVSESKGLTFIVEDATIWLNQRTSDIHLKKLVIGCRHNRIACIFLFHSLNRIPTFIYEQADFMYLFETVELNNTWHKVTSPKVRKAHDDLKKLPKHSYKFLSL